MLVYLQSLLIPIDVRVLQGLRQQHLLLLYDVFGLKGKGRWKYVLEEEVIFGGRKLGQTHLNILQSLISNPFARVDNMRCNLSNDAS